MKRLLILGYILSSTVQLTAQGETIHPYIDAWKTTGIHQTYKAQVFYDSLYLNKNKPGYRQKYLADIKKLQQFIHHINNTRLKVRLMMFEIMAAREFGYEQQYYKTIDEAIKLAYPLYDDQLNAELYSIRADIPPSAETNLLYNLKAIQIQRRIGFKYFPYVQNRYFGISSTLYAQGDYKRAIYYGRQCIDVFYMDQKHLDPHVYIFQCDILGAAYKKLKLYDSTRYFYSKILQALQYEKDTSFVKIWEGIGKGNLGIVLMKKNDYSHAKPLLETYLQNSIITSDSLNIVLAKNALAHFYFEQQQYKRSLSAAYDAFSMAKAKNLYPESITASSLLRNIYHARKLIDSTLFYYERENKYKNLLKDSTSKFAFSVVKAQIAFDNIQHSLKLTQSSAKRERSILISIIIVLILLTIIALLLYNRKVVRHKFKLKIMEIKHVAAKREITEAREKIRLFYNCLMEKTGLIRALEKKINSIETTQNHISTQLLERPLLTEAEWENFRTQFTKAYPYFYQNLFKDAERVTPAMERLASLIFLQLSNYQIANNLGISKDSVARSKRRLRTTLGLTADDDLEKYILDLAKL